MPITEELKNVKHFESVGFNHEQSEALADVIEQSHAQGQENLKEFIRNENDKLLTGINSQFTGINSQFKDVRNEFEKQTKDFDAKLSALETRLMISQKDLLIKIFSIIVGTVGVAVAILKLF